MSKFKVNQAAVEKIRAMIEAYQSVRDSKHLEGRDGDEFGKWRSTIDTTASAQTDDHYGFICGKLRPVQRTGLIAAKRRAAQHDHTAIVNIDDDLLQKLDQPFHG